MWLNFLNAETEEELDMLKQTNVPTITKAVEVIYNYSADARMMELYESRAEGIEKGRAEIEANLRRMAMSQEQTDEALGRKA